MTALRSSGPALAGLLLLIGTAAGSEQPPASPAPLSLDDYQIIQYVSTRGFAPEALMKLDSNDELLMACLRPLTRQELEATGITFIESQLVLLNAMGMLGLAEGRCETTLPFLGAERSEILRATTRAVAGEIVADVTQELKALRAALDGEGYGRQAYAIVFSYVLDGMVWDFFEEYGKVRPRRLSVSQPHWAGEVWGVYPPRRVAPTTSSFGSQAVRLKISHSELAGEKMKELLASWRELRDWLQTLEGGEEAAAPDLVARLKRYGLLDENGQIGVAEVLEEPGDPVFEAAQRLTEKLVDRVVEDLQLEKLVADLGLRSPQQALIIAYHELMWDLLEQMEREGLVDRPRLLRETQEEKDASDVAELVFLVRRPSEEQPMSQDSEESRVDEEG